MNLITTLPKLATLKQAPPKQIRRERHLIYPYIDQENTEKLIAKEVGQGPLSFLKKHVSLNDGSSAVFATATRFNVDKLPKNKFHSVVNLYPVNSYRWINKFFESVNNKLPIGGVFVNKVETYSNRRERMLRKSIFPLNWILYAFDVLFHRVFPKVPITKKFYFWATKGRDRVFSMAETYGRLYSCGFEIMDEQHIDGFLYFASRKTKAPFYPENPTYGPLIKLKRHGKDGKLFNVYKLRTMHAYSEYLQEYIYKKNDLDENGKFKNDFRVTTEGKIFRKFWLDELPMLINVFRGEMKIVGVRPLSSQYFNLYSDELKEKRVNYKPGLIPPFYADMPKSLEEIMESEMRYLEAYKKHPFLTDLKYFIKAWTNIIVKRARSS